MYTPQSNANRGRSRHESPGNGYETWEHELRRDREAIRREILANAIQVVSRLVRSIFPPFSKRQPTMPTELE